MLYVDEGDVLTSAGTGAGIDLCLHLVRSSTHGAAVANDGGPAHGGAAAPRRRPGAVRADLGDARPATPGSRQCSTGPASTSHQPLTVADLARQAGLSQRTFARRFADATGVSPLHWLTSERVRLAQELLETTDEPVERIARLHRLRHRGQPAPAFPKGHKRFAADLPPRLPLSPMMLRVPFWVPWRGGNGENDLKRLAQVCAAYRLGDLRVARYQPIGVINRNWRVDRTTGTYAVKELCDSIATGAHQQHRTMKLLIDRGVPIPEPLEQAGGDPVCAVDGARFTVSRWAPGQHLTGSRNEPGQAETLGDLLGGIHVALGDVLEAGDSAQGIEVSDPGQALSYLDFLLEIIEGKPERDEIDEVALANLTWRRQLLTDPALSAPPGEELGPLGYIHGDFHHNNVLWDEGRISAVLDWDRIRVHSLASELIRTFLLTFGGDGAIDLSRTAAFVRGYLQRRPMSVSELADAERRMWWLWLCGFWPTQPALRARGHHLRPPLRPQCVGISLVDGEPSQGHRRDH